LTEKHGKRPLGRYRRRWKNNVELVYRNCERVAWIKLAQRSSSEELFRSSNALSAPQKKGTPWPAE
jgi:hypothetical protein